MHQELEVSDDGGRVLSIQSHVVQGYVGNKSAVFPLQLLGMDVDPINSVQFSNHTGYAKFTGRRLTGDELHELLDGMEINDLLKDAHTHLLTGYIGSISLLDAIVRVYERIRAAQTHPERLVYVCDPVMGDLGKLYVPLELVDMYRSKVLPICDVLTPNQYECELLAEMELRTVKDAMHACKKLHTLGPKVVVISSFQEASEDETPKELVVIGSKVITGGRCEQYEVRFPWIDSYYTGTGDLFAALLLAWLYRFPDDFKRALENVISTIQDVLRITLKLGGKDCDLKLIQSRHVIANPTVRFFAKPLSVPILFVLVDLDTLLGTTSNDEVVDVPADASIQRRELLSALASLVGAENVSIVTNYTVSSTQALLSAFKVISSMEVGANADHRIETRNCETLVVSSSASLTALASRTLYQVAPSTASDEAVLAYIKEHNAQCLLA
ncbi:pyridoxal kinase [Phytophthora nicotianae CJ01A1]|uniref:pyridoxal kinase n=2 Tax=Phytophthora nicotianae TaxID=4792 RepID=W2XN45_PHYNI|nr:pyridoxal kinase [Phytophthora nicotianae]ETP23828.1 pyridoxal kinase [Phytophthora nicotianae CJ01A1]